MKTYDWDDLVLEKPDVRIVELIEKPCKQERQSVASVSKNNVVDGTLIHDGHIYPAPSSEHVT